MRTYEALVILRSAGSEQELGRHAAQVEDTIKKVGGRVESAQNMGRRRLAYRISRQTEGYYHLLRFQAPTEQIGELKRLLRLNESIVRFMILTADNLTPWTPGAGRETAGVSSSGRGHGGSGRSG